MYGYSVHRLPVPQHCVLCNATISHDYAHCIVYTFIAYYYICHNCVRIPTNNDLLYGYMRNQDVVSAIDIYNDMFLDSMDIVEYLKLALGRVP